jgi:predicted transcriptional regulator
MNTSEKAAYEIYVCYSRIRGTSVKILEAVEKNQRLCFSEIQRYLNLPKYYVATYLRNLRSYGLVKKIEHDWELTEEGKLFLERRRKIMQSGRKKSIKKDIRKGIKRSKFIPYNNDNNNIANNNKYSATNSQREGEISHVLNSKMQNSLSSFRSSSKSEVARKSIQELSTIKRKILQKFPPDSTVSKKSIEDIILQVIPGFDRRAVKDRIRKLEAEEFIKKDYEDEKGFLFKVIGDKTRYESEEEVG